MPNDALPPGVVVIDDLLGDAGRRALLAWAQQQPLPETSGDRWAEPLRRDNGEVGVGELHVDPLDAEGPGSGPRAALLARLAALRPEIPWIPADAAIGTRVYAWRPGAGIGWHRDTGHLGAFSYYLHDRWRSSWGGELLCGDRRAGRGAFVAPRPDRIVIVAAGVNHKVARTSALAPVRWSLQGFVRPHADLNRGDA